MISLNDIMPNYDIKISSYDRSHVISHIVNQRNTGVFTVVNLGGSIGWSTPYN